MSRTSLTNTVSTRLVRDRGAALVRGCELCTFLNFSNVPCLSGMRYAQQALKLAVVAILRKYKIVKCDQTIPESDLKFSITKNGFQPGVQFKVETL